MSLTTFSMSAVGWRGTGALAGWALSTRVMDGRALPAIAMVTGGRVWAMNQVPPRRLIRRPLGDASGLNIGVAGTEIGVGGIPGLGNKPAGGTGRPTGVGIGWRGAARLSSGDVGERGSGGESTLTEYR